MSLTSQEKIQAIYNNGAFFIKPKLGPFARSIGKTVNDLIEEQKVSINRIQMKIKNEMHAPSHELEVYFELLTELLLIRDLKLLSEKYQNQQIDENSVKSIIQGYQILIIKFKKDSILTNVLQAINRANINDVINVPSESLKLVS